MQLMKLLVNLVLDFTQVSLCLITLKFTQSKKVKRELDGFLMETVIMNCLMFKIWILKEELKLF
mgnify:CR=1 FL=1